MTHKKFMDIERIKAGYADGFRKGDIIYIEEKLTARMLRSALMATREQSLPRVANRYLRQPTICAGFMNILSDSTRIGREPRSAIQKSSSANSFYPTRFVTLKTPTTNFTHSTFTTPKRKNTKLSSRLTTLEKS